ncbi:TrbI/VirB10 family protein [Paraburkholderia elongata]|uniref:Conjugal transfer protein TrbI n=1 Tax=Paraburkholderia elongata TaxID=2675747 RepID=A0A972SMC5_9BURK|nr:TrbI/VirB10 family protein [Paraburkholderia elongata]NPT58720.1 conjugal transfer protein TrbI [Paraburkholderia elongata]
MAKQTDPIKPNAEQQALVKGKTSRNAILSIGLLAALVIGALGFYYELKASNESQEEARLKKAAALKSSAEVPATKNSDIDQLIRQQQEAAASEAAARAASDAATAARPTVKPALTGNDFQNEVSREGGDTRELSEKNNKDTIYTSSVFKQSGASRNANQQTSALPPGVPSLDDFRAARAAATTNPTEAMALALAKQGQAPEDRDRAFLKDAAGQGGIEQTTFNGRSRGCTLTPPHNIHVKTVEGLNSDKPGRVALMVDEDVHDSLQGDCLMIPKGSFINGAYSADIKVGQERLLVASTSLRLPNGKSVPMNGMQGADQNGYAGFSGDVNNHFLAIFGAGFITAVLLKTFDNNATTATTASPTGVTTYGSTAGQVAATTAQSVLQRNQNIPPTITVPPGQKFLVQVTQDIVMEPYHD